MPIAPTRTSLKMRELTMLNTVPTAIILAAGKGDRLYPLTNTQPKPMTRVGGRSIIARLVAQLVEVGVSKVVVVTGHLGDQLRSSLTVAFPDLDLHFIHNDEYWRTNNIYSLWLAREHFEDDFLLLESDVVCGIDALRVLVDRRAGSSACLVSPKAFFMDGACVKITGYPPHVTAPEQILDSQVGPEHYKTVNFYRIASDFASGWLVDYLKERVERGELSGYYETAFAEAINAEIVAFEAVLIPQGGWFEVDNLNDLDIAEFAVMAPSGRNEHLRSRHGGYWRYPITDHCLLYNLYYPPKKLLSHLGARLEHLLREYPSSQKPIARHLSQYYGLGEETVAVANGVSEFIPIVLDQVTAPVLIPTPSFNEYETVVPDGLLVRVPLHEADGFRVDPDHMLAEAKRTSAGHIILISPNNPTGAAVPARDIERIVEGAHELGCRVVLDESFVDFQAEGRQASFLGRLATHPNLTILFSLSKSHGIGGIRIGLMASADASEIKRVRERLPIWNVNAFAEEYLRMFSAYRREYSASCAAVREETDRLRSALSEVDGITAYPSDSNFVFCKLQDGAGTAAELTSQLLSEFGIFIKDCSGKSMPQAERFFRVASRGARDNFRLTRAVAMVVARRMASSVRREDADAAAL